MKNIFILFILLIQIETFAKSETVSEKLFTNSIEKLSSALKAIHKQLSEEGDAVKQGKILLKSGVRVAAFDMQSLGRLYADYPEKDIKKLIKDVRKSGKDLEDALGAFDKFESMNEKKEAKEAAGELMTLIYDEGFLDEDGETPLLKKLKKEVGNANWKSEQVDRSFVLSQLIAQLEVVRTTPYDMGRLEEGLHELRRELRWFSIYGRNIDGLLTAQKASCPISKTPFAQYADKKYSTLPAGNISSCNVSKCLYLEVVGANGLFAELKDEAEPIVEKDKKLKENDLTPPDIAKRATTQYQIFLKSGVIDLLQNEIRSCQ